MAQVPKLRKEVFLTGSAVKILQRLADKEAGKKDAPLKPYMEKVLNDHADVNCPQKNKAE